MSIQENKPLRAVPNGKEESWRKDPEYFSRYFLASTTKENLAQPTPVRLDQDVQVEMSRLIASGKTPYKTPSEFIRDSVTKNLRYQMEHIGDAAMLAATKRVWNYQESEHRSLIAERNKKFLEQQKKGLDNAQTNSEVSRVLELCKEAEGGFEGRQLEELEELISSCRKRFT